MQTALAVPGGNVGGLTTADLQARAARLRLPLAVDRSAVDNVSDASLAAFYGPSMAMVVLLVVVQVAARSLLVERQRRTYDRLMVLGATPRNVLGAKVLVSLLLGMATMTATLFTVAAVTGARWGDPLTVGVLCLATVAAYTSVGALLTAVSPNDEIAAGLGVVAGLLLSLVGGNFVPASQAPELLQRVADLTPNGWALKGFARLSVGDGIGAALPSIAALLVFAAVVGGVAFAAGNRRVVAR